MPSCYVTGLRHEGAVLHAFSRQGVDDTDQNTLNHTVRISRLRFFRTKRQAAAAQSSATLTLDILQKIFGSTRDDSTSIVELWKVNPEKVLEQTK